MENIQNTGEQDPKEKLAEEDALKVVADEEIRSQIVEKYGLNEDDNSELIDKIVEDKKEGHKELSTAIRQKIDWRTKAQTPKEIKPEVKPQEPVKTAQPISVEELDKRVDERFEERDLASMDLSDELKSEVKAYAKAKGTSYRQAVKSEYFNFIKGKEDERVKAEEASASSKGTTIKAKRDFGNLSDEQIADIMKNGDDETVKALKEFLKTQG